MKDASNYLLTALSSLLSGEISSNGSNVKFYAIAQAPTDNDNLFVNVSSAYVNKNKGNKDHFVRSYSINLDIVSRSNSTTLSEQEINNVANQIGVLLAPSPGTFGLIGNNEFNVVKIDIADGRSFNNKLAELWHLRKVLTIDFLVEQL